MRALTLRQKFLLGAAALGITFAGFVVKPAEAQFGVIGCQPANQVPVPCVVDSAGRIVVTSVDTTNTTFASSAAAESGRVIVAAPGTLAAIFITASTVSGYMMVFDSITVPADGAVVPKLCVYVSANNTVGFTYPTSFATGISVAFSTTGCFAKAASATAFFSTYRY